MSEPQKQCSLLDELERRQDDVLSQLEDLNEKLEVLLRDCLAQRSPSHELVEA